MRYREQVLEQLAEFDFTLNDKDEPVAKDGKTSQDLFDGSASPHAQNGWWQRVQEDYEAAAIVALAEIIEQLEDAGVTRVVANYAGSGDEGWIEDVLLYRGEEQVEEAHYGSFNYGQGGTDLTGSVQDWVHAELDRKAGGWENNEGAQGTITLDVKAREVEVDHSINVETTEPMPWSTSL